MSRNLFHTKLRDGAEYRRERLEAEHERLELRLRWAMQRQDDKAIDRLTRQLDVLERDLEDDLLPGRTPGRIEAR